MLAFRASSRLSPLLNTALSRYSTRPSDYPWSIYNGGFYRRHLLIGESLGVQAFDVYRNFFLYHSIAPYTIPALRYRYDYPNFSPRPLINIDEYIFGTLGFIWNIGTWFVKCAGRFIKFCLPTVPAIKSYLTGQGTTEDDKKTIKINE